MDVLDRLLDGFGEQTLRKTLTIHARRCVRRDSTLPMDGTDWEADRHFLAGTLLTGSRYVRLRFAAVGCNKEPFTSDAIALLHEGHLRLPARRRPLRSLGAPPRRPQETQARRA